MTSGYETVITLFTATSFIILLENLYIGSIFYRTQSKTVGEFKFHLLLSVVCSLVILSLFFLYGHFSYHIYWNENVEDVNWMVVLFISMLSILCLSTFLLCSAIFYQTFSLNRLVINSDQSKKLRAFMNVLKSRPVLIMLLMFLMTPIIFSKTILLVNAFNGQTHFLNSLILSFNTPKNFSPNESTLVELAPFEWSQERILLMALSSYGGIFPCIMCFAISFAQRRQMNLMMFSTLASGVRSMYSDYHKIFLITTLSRLLVFGFMLVVLLDIFSADISQKIFYVELGILALFPFYEHASIAFHIKSFRRKLFKCQKRSENYQLSHTQSEFIPNQELQTTAC